MPCNLCGAKLNVVRNAAYWKYNRREYTLYFQTKALLLAVQMQWLDAQNYQLGMEMAFYPYTRLAHLNFRCRFSEADCASQV